MEWEHGVGWGGDRLSGLFVQLNLSTSDERKLKCFTQRKPKAPNRIQEPWRLGRRDSGGDEELFIAAFVWVNVVLLYRRWRAAQTSLINFLFLPWKQQNNRSHPERSVCDWEKKGSFSVCTIKLTPSLEQSWLKWSRLDKECTSTRRRRRAWTHILSRCVRRRREEISPACLWRRQARCRLAGGLKGTAASGTAAAILFALPISRRSPLSAHYHRAADGFLLLDKNRAGNEEGSQRNHFWPSRAAQCLLLAGYLRWNFPEK